jgi:hypothetical protein
MLLAMARLLRRSAGPFQGPGPDCRSALYGASRPVQDGSAHRGFGDLVIGGTDRQVLKIPRRRGVQNESICISIRNFCAAGAAAAYAFFFFQASFLFVHQRQRQFYSGPIDCRL